MTFWMSNLPSTVKKESGWNWKPYTLLIVSSMAIATLDSTHLIDIFNDEELKGSLSLREW